MSRRIFLLGHRGMLGHAAGRHFAERGYVVETSDARYAGDADDALIAAVRASAAPFVLNCLGRIKQKSGNYDELYRGNAVFPLHLRERMRTDQHLFHASSDCVFSGTRGGYRMDDARDATDVYGMSKVLGETVARAPRTTVVRVSIVGPEDGDGAGSGLLAWFLRQPVDRSVPGFANHFWNGITTLEWATLVHELIERAEAGDELPAMMQPGTEAVSKYALLGHIRDAFGTAHEIRATDAPERIDRTLEPTLWRAPIEQQLAVLATWVRQAPVGC